MKIECVCGSLIPNMTDSLPHKAHLIPDQSWLALLEQLDHLIEHRCATPAQRGEACMAARILISEASRNAWQCASCGRLHVDDQAKRLQTYVPADGETSRSVLRDRR